MSSPVSSIPDAWVERIWAAMRATYGAAFDRQWECPEGVNPVDHVRDMKAAWGRALAPFQQNVKAITGALENLPAHPPNLIEFRTLCRSHVPVPRAALPPPGPRQIPEPIRMAMKALATPRDDKRPEYVRVAYRYIELRGNDRKPTPFHAQKLADMREVVRLYEAQLERDRQREATMGAPACQ